MSEKEHIDKLSIALAVVTAYARFVELKAMNDMQMVHLCTPQDKMDLNRLTIWWTNLSVEKQRQVVEWKDTMWQNLEEATTAWQLG